MKSVIVLEHAGRSWISNPAFGPSLRARVPNHIAQYDPASIGLVIFGGGVDVDPKYYHQQRASFTQAPDEERDRFEFGVAEWAAAHGIPMVGLCRGAQLLTILNGGTLIQHVSNHAGRNHGMQDKITGRYLMTNSCHHQMMFPWTSKNEFEVLAAATPRISTTYLGEDNLSVFKDKFGDTDFILNQFVEPEVLWWPGTKALCVQGHPEWLTQKDQLVKYVNDLMDSLILHENVDKTCSPAGT